MLMYSLRNKITSLEASGPNFGFPYILIYIDCRVEASVIHNKFMIDFSVKIT